MFEHQPRERATRCTRCNGSTWNVHATCDNCIRDGARIECHSVCDEVARTLAMTA